MSSSADSSRPVPAAVRRSARPWLRLLRPPNLPTVPGDPLAGYALAMGGAPWDGRVAAVMAASLLLYAGGLVLNDVADVGVDRRERPNRPLPSGAIPRRHGLIAGLALCGLGMAAAVPAGAAATAGAAVLAGLVLVYDFVTPRGTLPGLVTMGFCRGASVALGIAAAGRPAAPAVAAAIGIGIVILAISWIACGETRPQHVGRRRWLPVLAWCGPAAFIAVASSGAAPGRDGMPAALVALALVTLSLAALHRVGATLGPAPAVPAVPPAIGRYIRCLLPMQAACCASAGNGAGLFAAAGLLALWPLAARLSRRFYAS